MALHLEHVLFFPHILPAALPQPGNITWHGFGLGHRAAPQKSWCITVMWPAAVALHPYMRWSYIMHCCSQLQYRLTKGYNVGLHNDSSLIAPPPHTHTHTPHRTNNSEMATLVEWTCSIKSKPRNHLECMYITACLFWQEYIYKQHATVACHAMGIMTSALLWSATGHHTYKQSRLIGANQQMPVAWALDYECVWGSCARPQQCWCPDAGDQLLAVEKLRHLFCHWCSQFCAHMWLHVAERKQLFAMKILILTGSW